MGYIYLRPNLVNGKKYVGQATDLKVRQRNWNNLNQPYAGPLINRARAKYGLDAFGFEILKECEDDALDQWEMYYIKELNTKSPNGYNLTEGGGGSRGYVPSEETKRKISETKKGQTPWNKGKIDIYSEETKRKISESRKGVPNWSKAVLQIDKVTGQVIGEFVSIAEVQRQLGFKQCHISSCCNGKRKTCGGFIWRYKENGWFDELLPKYDDCRRNINGKKSKAILQCDLDGNIIAEFPSAAEVKRQFGYDKTAINRCCHNKQKSSYGFIWKYKEDVA